MARQRQQEALSARHQRRDLTLLRESLAPQPETGVEPRAVVLQRDPPGQLDDLLVAEGTPQPLGEVVRTLRRRSVARLGVFEDEPLAFVVEIAVPPDADVADFRARHAGLHALVV